MARSSASSWIAGSAAPGHIRLGLALDNAPSKAGSYSNVARARTMTIRPEASLELFSYLVCSCSDAKKNELRKLAIIKTMRKRRSMTYKDLGSKNKSQQSENNYFVDSRHKIFYF